MKNFLSQLDFFPSAPGKKVIGKNKTPGEVGDSLFKGFLEKSCRSSQKQGVNLSSFHQTLLSLNSILNRNLGQGHNFLSIHTSKLNQKIPQNHNIGLDRFKGLVREPVKGIELLSRPNMKKFGPGASLGQPGLPEIIGELGADISEIGAGLQALRESQNFLVISSGNIPQIEEILYRVGLGAGDVKNVIDKSMNRNGNLDLIRFAKALSMEFSGPVQGKHLAGFMECYNMKTGSGTVNPVEINPELETLTLNFSRAETSDAQSRAKQEISALLAERGVPSQEIKTFLETLNIGFSRSVLKGMTFLDNTENSNQALSILRGDKGWCNRSELHERAIEILHGDRLMAAKDTDRSWYQQPGEKQTLFESLASSDKKAKIELFNQLSEARTLEASKNTSQEKSSSNQRFGHLSKEVAGADFMVMKAESSVSKSALISQVRDQFNFPQPLPKILDRMIFMIRTGEQRGRIMINPPDLGRLDMDIAYKQGHLQANLSAESLVVKEMIEANLNQLKQELAGQGFVVDKFDVMVGLNNREFKDGDSSNSNSKDQKHPSSGNSPRLGDGSIANGDNIVKRSITSGLYQIDVHV